jgi:hypothetical protein
MQFMYDITDNGNGDIRTVVLTVRQMFLTMINKAVTKTGIELVEKILRNY